MTYGDDRFSDLLSKVEKMPRPPQFSACDSDQKTLANKFFAILSSYLRGKDGRIGSFSRHCRKGWISIVV